MTAENSRIQPWLLLIFSCSVLIFSCTTNRYAYSPSAQNIPLLTEKGDSKLGMAYSTSPVGTRSIDDVVFRGRSNGVDIQGAYAISNHFALQANFFSRAEMNGGISPGISDSAVIRYKRHLGEIGAGYFRKLGDNDYGELYFQFFAGVAFGKFSFTDDSKDLNGNPTQNFHEAAITKFYFQPAIMFQYNKKLEIAISSRFSVVNYRNIKTDYTDERLETYKLKDLRSKPLVFWEPALVNAIGLGPLPVRLEWQVGASILASQRFVDFRSLNLSVGLQSDINRLFKKKPAATRRD